MSKLDELKHKAEVAYVDYLDMNGSNESKEFAKSFNKALRLYQEERDK